MEVDRVLKNVINQSVRVKILRRFISELPFYLFDYFFIAISLIANLIKYKLPYKKDLVIVTGSDNYFATSLFQLLDNINLNSDAKALITTPAAGKFYRSAGPIAYQKQILEVANHGVLEWFPSENIFFPGAKVKLETRIKLFKESHFIGWDILCLGRPSIGETFDNGQLTQRLEIFMDGRLIRLEKLIIKENDLMLNAKWGLRGKPVVGTLFCLTSRTDLVDLLRDSIESLDGDNLLSVTLVDNVILCRYLGNSVEQVKQKFIKVWQVLRMALRGRESVIPRIWST